MIDFTVRALQNKVAHTAFSKVSSFNFEDQSERELDTANFKALYDRVMKLHNEPMERLDRNISFYNQYDMARQYFDKIHDPYDTVWVKLLAINMMMKQSGEPFTAKEKVQILKELQEIGKQLVIALSELKSVTADQDMEKYFNELDMYDLRDMRLKLVSIVEDIASAINTAISRSLKP